MNENSTEKNIYSEWNDWDARGFILDYFFNMEPEEAALLNFLFEKFKTLKNKETILEFGCGPVPLHAIAVEPYVSKIHLADFLPQNLDEIRLWLKKDRKSFNWKRFSRYILKIEGKKITKSDIQSRENATRKKITRLIFCDISKKAALPQFPKRKYPIVMSLFCPDSVTDSRKDWKVYMRNMLALVQPGGYVFLSSLRKAKFYKINEKKFPSANVDENDVKTAFLKAGFDLGTMDIRVREMPACAYKGFKGIILAYAQKSN